MSLNSFPSSGGSRRGSISVTRAFAFLILLGISLSALAQQSIFPALVGEWNHVNSGQSIDIRENGDVWATDRPMARVSATIEGGGNFAFEGKDNKGNNYRCVYYVTFLARNDMSNWRTVANTGDVQCLEGLYGKTEKYASPSPAPSQTPDITPSRPGKNAEPPTAALTPPDKTSKDSVLPRAAVQITIARQAQLNKDCSLAGLPQIRIRQAKNGKVFVKSGPYDTNRAPASSYIAACRDRINSSIPGIHLVYSPNTGFVGTDTVIYTVTYRNEWSATHRVLVSCNTAGECRPR